MNPTPAFSPSMVELENGLVVHAFGEKVVFHLTGEQTGGNLTLWTEFVPPQGGPPPHYHRNEDEWFVVQEGSFEFLVDGNWKPLAPGGTLYLPKNAVHTFKNVGETEGRLLVATSPSGFETFFSQCAEVFQSPEGPDMGKIVAIAEEHGIHFMT